MKVSEYIHLPVVHKSLYSDLDEHIIVFFPLSTPLCARWTFSFYDSASSVPQRCDKDKNQLFFYQHFERTIQHDTVLYHLEPLPWWCDRTTRCTIPTTGSSHSPRTSNNNNNNNNPSKQRNATINTSSLPFHTSVPCVRARLDR